MTLGAAAVRGAPTAPQVVAFAPRLNMGCGGDVRDGWENVDAFNTTDPRVRRHDMTMAPWPFPDDTFTDVYLGHVLEHIPFHFYPDHHGGLRDVLLDVLDELYRVTRHDGRIEIRVPHGHDSEFFYCHWQHYRRFTPGQFAYFSGDHPEGRHYSRARFRIVHESTRPWGTAARYRRGPRIRGLYIAEHLTARSHLLHRLLACGRELRIILTPIKADDAALIDLATHDVRRAQGADA